MRNDTLIFKRLNYCFYGLLFCAPYLIGFGINSLSQMPYVAHQTSGIVILYPETFSTFGRRVVLLEFITQVGFCVVLIALMHLRVRSFAKGRILVSDTLRTMKTIAALFFVWSIVELLVKNGVQYTLFRVGDMAQWSPFLFVDPIKIAVGLLLASLCILIRHAIVLQEDSDLTV